MKITIGVDQLRKDGQISNEEYARFKDFARKTTRKLAFKNREQ